MSAIDNSEISPQQNLDEVQLSEMIKTPGVDTETEDVSAKYTIKKPKRILHFSDGTMEEYDDDSDDDDDHGDGVEKPFQKSSPLKKNLNEPNVNPKNLSWPSWLKHYGSVGGSKTLGFLDRTGESLAYYLGITTPKYQYEIDEYNRAKEEELKEKKVHDEDLKSWSTSQPTNESNGPIISPKELKPTVQITKVEPSAN